MADHLPDDRITRGPAQPPPGSFQANPPEPEALPSLGGGSAGDVGLSGLAQSAREKQINSARTILYIIGVLTIVFNVVLIFLASGQMDDELRKMGWNPHNLAPDQQLIVQGAKLVHYGVLGAFVLMGVVFIVLGTMVRSYPVPCTIAGLVLFIGGGLVQLVLDPGSLAFGWIIKVIIIVSLFKAVQAALAAEREKQAALAGMDEGA